MKRIILSWALVLLATPLLPAADVEKTSLHLVARPAVDVETTNGYLRAGEKARAALVALKAELQGLHGKKEKNWPADARERYGAAEKADERAADVSWYGVNLQPDLDDSLRDLTEAVADKKRLRVAAGREDADLVVEILGRNRGRFGGQLGNSSHIALRLTAGPRLDPAVVQQLKWHFGLGLQRRIPVFESEDPPSVTIEIVGAGIGWRFATTMAANVLDYNLKDEPGSPARRTSCPLGRRARPVQRREVLLFRSRSCSAMRLPTRGSARWSSPTAVDCTVLFGSARVDYKLQVSPAAPNRFVHRRAGGASAAAVRRGPVGLGHHRRLRRGQLLPRFAADPRPDGRVPGRRAQHVRAVRAGR